MLARIAIVPPLVINPREVWVYTMDIQKTERKKAEPTGVQTQITWCYLRDKGEKD